MTPFADFSDPVHAATSYAAFDQAWGQIAASRTYDDTEKQRQRLACIVARYAPVAANQHDLVQRAVERFRETR